MRSYSDYINEKKAKSEEGIPATDPVYWIIDATSNIAGTLQSIMVLSGFSTNKKIYEEYQNILKDPKDLSTIDGFNEYLNNISGIITKMLSVPSNDWRKGDKKLKPYALALKLKGALEDLQNAITITKNASVKSQEELERLKEPRNAKANDFHRFTDDIKNNVNYSIALLNFNRKINTYQSLADALYAKCVALQSRISYLSSFMMSIRPSLEDDDKIKELDGMNKELIAIREPIEGLIKALSTKGELDKGDYQTNKAKYEGEDKAFTELKDQFFYDYAEKLEANAKSERVNELIDSSNDKVKEGEEMITDSAEARRMFKGLSEDNPINQYIGSETEKSIDAADEAARKRRIDSDKKEAPDNREEAELNMKTIKKDEDIWPMFNIEDSIKDINIQTEEIKKLLNLNTK